jgi:hypothetical protein
VSPTAFLWFEIAGGVVAILVAHSVLLVATVCCVFRQGATPWLWLVWAGCVFCFVQAVAVAVKFTRWVSDGSGL